MNNRFLQLHLLTSYPPSNLNRDDLGRPKTASMGGFQRLRVSSQSLKRAWRTSELFEQALGNHIGTRSRIFGRDILASLKAEGVAEADAITYTRAIVQVFGELDVKDTKLSKGKGKAKGKKADAETSAEPQDGAEEATPMTVEGMVAASQLVHIGPDEQAAIKALVKVMARENRAPNDDELNLLRKTQEAADIALFGRMLAAKPYFNVEAAAQVAHAVTVHKAQVEDDFFSAVDDLNDGSQDKGSAHMGEVEFGAGLFYLYICVDRHLLLENLGGNRELAGRVLKALLECAAKVAPTGKQATFASRAYASYILAELGNQQPRNLSSAFLKPANGSTTKSVLDASIEALEATYEGMDKVYGPCASDRNVLSLPALKGSLDEMGVFVAKA